MIVRFFFFSSVSIFFQLKHSNKKSNNTWPYGLWLQFYFHYPLSLLTFYPRHTHTHAHTHFDLQFNSSIQLFRSFHFPYSCPGQCVFLLFIGQRKMIQSIMAGYISEIYWISRYFIYEHYGLNSGICKCIHFI